MISAGPSCIPKVAKILIVDDERDLVKMLVFVLQKKDMKRLTPMTGPKPGERYNRRAPTSSSWI